MSTDAVKEPDTLTEALLGKELLNMPMLAKFKAWPVEYRSTLVAAKASMQAQAMRWGRIVLARGRRRMLVGLLMKCCGTM